MATTIINAANIADGSSASSEMTNVGDLTVQVTVAGSTDRPEVVFTLKAKEGAAGYVDVTNENGASIQFSTQGNQSKRVHIKGIESESVKLYYTIGKGSTGTITALSTITAKTVA